MWIARWVVFQILTFVCFGLEYETVKTNVGPVTGVLTARSKNFLGIPYGRAKRFESAVPVKSWTKPLKAIKPGPMCYQKCPKFPAKVCQKRASENCLYLNIYRPLEDPVQGSKFAVMVFIHGGNFEFYSGGSKLYYGEEFVSKGKVILVTLNYRLGAFGFLATVSDGKVASGNYAVKDQRLALKWVHDNIAHFGGDPQKVTLFGQSAGAQSTALHLISGKADNHFQRVIIQSNPFTLPFRTPAEASKQSAFFAKHLGCSVGNLKCYQSKSPDEILKAMEKTSKDKISDDFLMRFETWGPVIDGDEVPSSLVPAFENGKFARKDAIIGTTSEEGVAYAYSVFSYDIPRPMYKMTLNMVLPKWGDSVAKLYPLSRLGNVKEALSKMTTDLVFYCSSRLAGAKLALQKRNVWFYIFDQPLSFMGWGKHTFCNQRPCHGVELPFLFNTPNQGGFNVTAADQSLSYKMMTYWSNFAKHGTPNHQQDRLPFWPRFQTPDRKEKKVLILKESGFRVGVNVNEKECNLWDKLGYTHPLKNTGLGIKMPLRSSGHHLLHHGLHILFSHILT